MIIRTIFSLIVMALFLLQGQAVAGDLCGELVKDSMYMGAPADRVFGAYGNPKSSGFDDGRGSSWMLYDSANEAWIQYQKGVSRTHAGFRVSNITQYLLSKDRTVIGYLNLVSHHPNKLESIREKFSKVDQIEWDIVHLARREVGYPMLLASRSCGDYYITLFAGCYLFTKTYAETLKLVEVIPQNLGECRYRGLIVHEKKQAKRSRVEIDPYEFGKK